MRILVPHSQEGCQDPGEPPEHPGPSGFGSALAGLRLTFAPLLVTLRDTESRW